MFAELFKYRDLLYMLTFRDIRIRYKQAAMGFLWAIFMPIVAVAAGMFIKKAIAVLSGNDLDMVAVVSISVKILPWTFFCRLSFFENHPPSFPGQYFDNRGSHFLHYHP